MQATDDSTGMLCTLCCKHSRRPKKSVAGNAVRTDVPCHSITRQALVKHCQSESHVHTVKLEAALASLRVDGGIQMALQRVASAERKALIRALK